VNRALFASATGMAAQQKQLDVIADNLANADVVGFKSAQATFAAIGANAELGTAATGTRAIFSAGKLERSGGPFDVAIEGAGFFRIERDGERAYTRAGAFSRARDGSLRNADGWKLCGVQVPAGAQAIAVAPSGGVSAQVDGHRKGLGRIVLVAFARPNAYGRSARRSSLRHRTPGCRACWPPGVIASPRLRSACSRSPTSPSSSR